jgi:hypothetical protein
MCTSYKVGDIKIFDAFSEFPVASFDFKVEIYKDYAAPILRRGADGFSTDPATFGMVPRKRHPARREGLRHNERAALPDPVRELLRAELRGGQAGALAYRYGIRRAARYRGSMARVGGARRAAVALVHHAEGQRRRAPVDEEIPQTR